MHGGLEGCRRDEGRFGKGLECCWWLRKRGLDLGGERGWVGKEGGFVGFERS